MVCTTTFRDEFDAHRAGDAAPAEPVLIAELVDIHNRQAVIDGHHRNKQPDWTYRVITSGSTPVELKRLSRRETLGGVARVDAVTASACGDRVDRSRYIAGSGSTNHSKENVMNVHVVGASGAI
jgi:hypothetical protein